ncbi:MAG: hypothetical protein PWP23_1718 [Candidatus Sumerlaeota bacterium]|nr:hypothetical protein [Candidatus Sumerlaeota bacterium]
MRSRTKQRGRAAGPPGLWGTLWRLTLVGAVLFAAAAAAGYATVAHLVKTPETQAPDLLAMELVDAIREASAEGFSARVAGSEPSSVLQPGQVAAQRPLPGTWVKEGATIQLILAE